MKHESRLSSIVFLIAFAVLAGYLGLVFCVPHLHVFWSTAGTPLSEWQQALIHFSRAAQNRSSAEIVFSFFVAALAWRISTAFRSRIGRRANAVGLKQQTENIRLPIAPLSQE